MYMTISSIMFIFMSHPLTLGSILLIQTIFSALITGMMNFNYWFSYIMFLIMIGGMLILFMYMTSVASNEKFKFSMNLFILWLTSVFSATIIYMFNKYTALFNYFNLAMSNQSLTSNNILSMSKLMNFPNNLNLILIILYLLISLIAIVKITKIQFGPLRQKF
uniref:NADH-ubiquinone oxidoreductase chain 6 n=1 Tax=Byctiscus populi TaxID=1069883 RepID=J9PJT7_BYCPO|nr:NADH dehydrogenase subunit 6 [Byctiscus populi]